MECVYQIRIISAISMLREKIKVAINYYHFNYFLIQFFFINNDFLQPSNVFRRLKNITHHKILFKKNRFPILILNLCRICL